MREEAERQGISVNALANRILQNYCRYGRWVERFGVIQIARPTISRIINCCPEDSIIEIAKNSATTVTKDALGSMGMDLTYHTIVNFIADSLGKNGRWFDYSQQKRGKKEIIHLHHELGRKWSIFTANQVASIFESLLNKTAKTDISDDFAIIEITM